MHTKFRVLASEAPEILRPSCNYKIGSRDLLVTPIDLIFFLFY